MKEYLKITNECNMELMARYPDNHFDLAIVDPPYGIGFDKKIRDKSPSKGWDNEIPNDDYFKELKRVCKNQIIWGGNYFPILWGYGCKGFIFWDKDPSVDTYSDGELAYTSFNKPAKRYYWAWNGLANGVKGRNKTSKTIHPTQKPVELYQWLLMNYAEPNFKILDTHLGSGSIAIAVDSVNKIEKMNLTLTACELDTEYYQTATRRIEEQTTWNSLF